MDGLDVVGTVGLGLQSTVYTRRNYENSTGDFLLSIDI